MILFFLSCEKLPTSKNPYAELPIAIMMGDPQVYGSSVDLFWESNGFATEYSYWLEPLSYSEPVSPYLLQSDWTTENTLTLNNLDEGDYNFFVKARNGQVEPEDSLALSMNFTISTIEGTTLRIYPMEQEAGGYDTLTIYVYASNIADIFIVELNLEYNSSIIEYSGSESSCGFLNENFIPVHISENSANSEGDVNSILTAYYCNLNEFDASLDYIIKLYFKRIGESNTEILIRENSIVRDSNGDDIGIETWQNGWVR